MTVVARIAFLLYVTALLGLGAFGVVLPEVELRLMYDVDFQGLDEDATTILLHQYRFLKAFAIGYGLWAVAFRREIATRSTYCAIFLVILFGAVAARTISIALDGQPGAMLMNFTISEIVFGLCILAGFIARSRRAVP